MGWTDTKIIRSPQFLPILSHLHVSFVYFCQTGEQIQKIIRSPQFLPILSHKIMFFFKKVNRYKKLSVHRFFLYSKPCTGLGERGERLFIYENIFFMGKKWLQNGYSIPLKHCFFTLPKEFTVHLFTALLILPIYSQKCGERVISK